MTEIVNTFQIVGPFERGEFVSADFKALEAYEYSRRAEPVIQALESILPSDHNVYDKHTSRQMCYLTAFLQEHHLRISCQCPRPSSRPSNFPALAKMDCLIQHRGLGNAITSFCLEIIRGHCSSRICHSELRCTIL